MCAPISSATDRAPNTEKGPRFEAVAPSVFRSPVGERNGVFC